MAAATHPVATIAKLLLLTDRRVQQLAAEGVIPRAEKGRYELVPVVQAYVRYLRERAVAGDAADPEAAVGDKARKTKAEADLAELEVRRLRGALVSKAKLEAALAVIDLALKDRLLTVPMAAAPEATDAAREGGVSAVAEVFARHLGGALVDVASAELVARAAS